MGEHAIPVSMRAVPVVLVDTNGNKIDPAISNSLSDTPKFFENDNFKEIDSPATLDLNAALGRNSTAGHITNDGPENFTYAMSNDGAVFGDAIKLKPGGTDHWEKISIDSIRITWIADSAYRVTAI